ncbi:MAG: hypothetical protein LBM77_03015 [Spirochaetaceae bacterium]|jgi:hypothetical protein|nr:hypothetical protein [Spirochaetaceae bacterium]
MMVERYAIGILTLAFIVIVIIVRNKQVKNHKNSQRESMITGIWCLTVLIFSFALFFYARHQSMVNRNLNGYIIAVGNSISDALELFKFKFPDDAISPFVGDSSYYFYFIALIVLYLAAGIWTYSIVVRTFFKGFLNTVRLRLQSLPFYRRDNVHFIIIGCGHKMHVFLENLIHDKDTKGKPVSTKDITIITGTPTILVKDTTEYYKEFITDGYTVIDGKADIDALNRAGFKNSARKIYVIAMTENDEQNLAIADIVTRRVFSIVFPEEKYPKRKYDELTIEQLGEIKDEVQSNSKELLKNVNIEGRIMYSSLDRTEHYAFADNAYGRVRFFNPYNLRTNHFFKNHPITSLIPGDFIDTNLARLKGSLVNGKILKDDGKPYIIKNMFIGFGATNAQLMKGSINAGQLLGCDYNAVVFDKSFSDITKTEPSGNQAIMMNQAPGLFPGGDETDKSKKYLPSPDEKHNIRFRHIDVLTKNFYMDVVEELKDSDFTTIYIALGDDKLAIETALEIRQTICEFGIDFSKIKLFVKAHEDSPLTDRLVINNAKNVPLPIECFGKDKAVFTARNIVNKEYDDFVLAVSHKDHDDVWDFMPEFKRESNRQAAIAIRTKLNLLGLDLVPADSISNEEKNEAIALYNARYKASEQVYYSVEEMMEDTARKNLARFEHQRWNVFHLANGWTKKPIEGIGAGNEDIPGTNNTGRQNRWAKQHACITTIPGLYELAEKQAIAGNTTSKEVDTVHYDFTVMDMLQKDLLNTIYTITVVKGVI